MLLRPKTGLKDMVAELDPGHASAGRAGGRRRHPGQPDAARRQPRRDPRRARRRHARLPDRAARARGAEGLRGNGPRAGRRAAPLRAVRPRYGRKVFDALAQRRKNIKRVIHNFSLVIDELGAKDDQLAEFVENSNAVFATLARQDANLRATLSELPSSLDETQRGLGKAKALADELGPTLQALRPGARALGPSLRAGAAVRARDDAGHARRDPAVRARLAPDGASELRPAARDLAAATPDLDALVQGRQPPAQHAGLQPAGQGRGLPVLGRLGEPHRQPALHDPGRARPDPPRPRSSPPARTCRCSTRSSSPTRCSAC